MSCGWLPFVAGVLVGLAGMSFVLVYVVLSEHRGERWDR